jgi:hypothetical protein
VHDVFVDVPNRDPRRLAPSSDRYGIPGNYFGHVDDDFYGVVGRIVMLASLVELKLFELLCTLDGQPGAHERYAGKPAGAVITECQRLLANERDLQGTGIALLDRAKSALEVRHGVVHNAWPYPSLEQAYGWRPAPLRLRSDDGQWITDVETNQGELRTLITQLVELVEELPAFRQRIEDQRWRRSAGAS